jgi:2-dehydropantoate 2-reductase
MTTQPRFVVYGAGAVGGVIGARLHQHGHDVVLIARGAHFESMRDSGLHLRSAHGDDTVRVAVVDSPRSADIAPDDVVLLAVKSQDTAPVLAELSAVAPRSTPVVCAQNGVANERAALRYFDDVYGVCIVLPAVHLEPGVVEATAAPVTGLLDIGRFPDGHDDVAARVADAFNASTFESVVRDDIMRWKYRKLLNNLGNALDALCGPGARRGAVQDHLLEEGMACLHAASIEFVSEAEDRERRGDRLQFDSAAARSRPGASTWQSMARGVAIEADFLNGEIVMLGRLHGVPTPVNRALLELVNDAARAGRPPGSFDLDEVIRIVLGGESTLSMSEP